MLDSAVVGRELERVRFPIERSKLAELARAFRDEDPTWHDPEAAREAGFSEVPVPPTVTVLAGHWREDGALSIALALGLDPRRLLHGEAAWEYLLPIRAGDELTASSRVLDVAEREGRRGGTMTLATVETEFVNQNGDVVTRRTDTLIETGG
jgi:acyl dehydratase